MTNHRLWLGSLLVAQWLVVADTQCTLCYDNGTPTELETGFLTTGVECKEINTIIGLTPDTSNECFDLQVKAYKGCGCPDYPRDLYCAMCDDAFFDIPNPLRQIPTLDISCDAALFLPIDGGQCQDAKRAAHYCGCPGAPEPVCFYCPNSNSDAGSTPPSHPNRLLPPRFDASCGDLQALAPFATAEECPALTAEYSALIDTDYYCGCKDTLEDPDNVACDLCPGVDPATSAAFDASPLALGGQVGTCANIKDAASAVIDSAYCTTLQDEFGDYCCLGLTPTPTAMPTVTPTNSPNVAGGGDDRNLPTATSGSAVVVWRGGWGGMASLLAVVALLQLLA